MSKNNKYIFNCEKKITLVTAFVILLFLLPYNNIHSQNKNVIGYLEIGGKAVISNKELSGAKITLYKNSMLEKQLITGKNGKFKFYIDYGYDYKITFSYPGYVDMYLLIFAKIPKDKYNIMPYYDLGSVPFFSLGNENINVEKYKDPFTKIIFDGNSLFIDNENYLVDFVKEIYVDPIQEAKALAAIIGKERAEQKLKKDAEEKARKAESTRLLAQIRALEEAEEKASQEELIRLKAEHDKQAMLMEQSNQAINEKEIQLLQEKEARALMEKKNRSIKSKYENEMLKLLALNEKINKEKTVQELKEDALSASVIQRIRMEAELKAKSDNIREQELVKDKKISFNQQVKSRQMKTLFEASAFAERAIKVSEQVILPDPHTYKMKNSINISIAFKEEFFKTIKITTVTLGERLMVLKKETYLWGSEYYYRNEQEINEPSYKNDIAKYISL